MAFAEFIFMKINFFIKIQLVQDNKAYITLLFIYEILHLKIKLNLNVCSLKTGQMPPNINGVVTL